MWHKYTSYFQLTSLTLTLLILARKRVFQDDALLKSMNINVVILIACQQQVVVQVEVIQVETTAKTSSLNHLSLASWIFKYNVD